MNSRNGCEINGCTAGQAQLRYFVRSRYTLRVVFYATFCCTRGNSTKNNFERYLS